MRRVLCPPPTISTSVRIWRLNILPVSRDMMQDWTDVRYGVPIDLSCAGASMPMEKGSEVGESGSVAVRFVGWRRLPCA